MRVVVVAVLRDYDGRVLVAQRSASARLHPLRWEFPGGKLEPGESEREALVRELAEELDLRLSPSDVGPLLLRLRHTYPETGDLELAFYAVPYAGAPLLNRVFADLRWEPPASLAAYDLLPADRPLLKLLE